jgi:hypothetical protein
MFSGWLHEKTCFIDSLLLQNGHLFSFWKCALCLSPVEHSFEVNLRTGSVRVMLNSDIAVAARSHATLSNWEGARAQLSFSNFRWRGKW